METYVLLILSAMAAGAINAVAGGGTLLTFPALLGALGSAPGMAAIANGTSTVSLVPGSLAALWGYRQEMTRVKRWVAVLLLPSLLGGVLGAYLVVLWPEAFRDAIPWLILTAAILFQVQPLLTRFARRAGKASPAENGPEIHQATAISERRPGLPLFVAGLQLLISIYGGYFGAGIGILMLAALGIMGLTDIHEMNALKTLLACVINGVSAIVFIKNGLVDWPSALAMSLASIVGGYAGARLARRVPREVVRKLVVVIGFSLACYYFYRQWRG